eukprot:TRINITY_DN132_c0_g1_i1.p1 TRINITY_DN132_c0_g1~~TRINITY_DN132_c0_g1_i1.p1  ORF type:complete len:172 (+),score=15.25 TRINITY_DN132_c0_g1_i1:152-667(+)
MCIRDRVSTQSTWVKADLQTNNIIQTQQKMKIIFLSLFIISISCSELFLPTENTIPKNFTSCQSGAKITINKAFIMSEPIKGQNVTFVLLGTVSGLVQLKQVNVVVSLEGVQITTLTYPETQVFTPGEEFEYKFEQFIPSYSPSGSFILQFKYMDISGNQDGCTQVPYTLS